MRQEGFLLKILDTLPYGIVFIEPQSTYGFWNLAYLEMNSLPTEGLQGRCIKEVLSQGVGSKLTSSIKKAFKSKKEVVYTRELPHTKRTKKHYLVKIIPLFNSDQSPSGALVLEEVISTQKALHTKLLQQLSQLRESRDDTKSYLEHIISHFPANVYWKDKKGRILGDNLSHAKMAGFNDQLDVIGKTDYEFPWKDQAAQIRQNDLEVMRTQQTQVFEEAGSLIDGTYQCFLTIKAPLYNRTKQVVGVIGISMDITERKEHEVMLKDAKERAEAADRAKSIFIANMSHDIRTPISGVIGMAEILEREGDTKKDRKYAHTIRSSSEQLLSLINDILELISAEQLKENTIKLDTFSIKERMNYLLELFASSVTIKKIELATKLDSDLPEFITTDRIKLDRILLNLLSNAIKFTEKGVVTLNVKQILRNEADITLEFQVIDTGIGIPEEELKKIFDRFYRVTPSYKGKYQGSGIGLFIARKYATTLGGDITVSSQLGIGTTFSVIIPVKIGASCNLNAKGTSKLPKTFCAKQIESDWHENSHMRAGDEVKNESPYQLSGLIIEDDAVARHIAKKLFQNGGYLIDDVDNAEAGFKKVVCNKYDFVVTDIGLPGMSGNEFTELVRYWEKATQHPHTPIIGLSAHGENNLEKIATGGMDVIFTKPIDELKINALRERFFSCTRGQDDRESLAAEKQSEFTLDFSDKESKLIDLTTFPLIDQQEAEKITGENLEQHKELLRILINDILPKETQLLKDYYRNSNWKGIQSIAHKLKGSAMYCGALRMLYACRDLEGCLQTGQQENRQSLYAQLLNILQDTDAHIREYLYMIT